MQNFSGGGRWVATGFTIDSIGYLGTGFDSTNYHRDFWEYSPDSSNAINRNNFSLTEIYCYPNPFSSEILVSVKKLNIKLLTITIQNIFGETLLMQEENNLNHVFTKSFDLGFLSSGIYLLHVNVDGEQTIKKIVKE